MPSGSRPDLVMLPWRLDHISADGCDVYIRFPSGGGCLQFRGIQLTETANSVTIAPRGRDHQRPRTFCDANLVITAGPVHLAAPLAHRRLIHPPPSKSWRGSV